MRVTVFCIALLTATTAAAQSQSKLEIGSRQGSYYWVVETSPDGSRKGGWVPVNVPIDAIDRNSLKPLPSVSALAAVEKPTEAPPAAPTLDERLAKIEQALAAGQGAPPSESPGSVQSAPIAPVRPQPRPTSVAPVRRFQSREGFWFNGGLGVGFAGCVGCLGREVGTSGGLSLGGT